MYSLFGFAQNIQSIYRLAAPYVGQSEVNTAEDLKSPYCKFLKDLHKDLPISMTKDLVVSDSSTARILMGAFGASSINDLQQEQMVGAIFNAEKSAHCQDKLKDAIRNLHELNPELSELFHLAVHSILLAESAQNNQGLKAHGGSTNACIGLIWLNLDQRLSTQDVIEMLIHELTHALVFIDELNFGHFHYGEMTKAQNFARSSILRRDRPLDKVVHSIVVSGEIISAREKFLPNMDTLCVHPSSSELARDTRIAIDSVLSLKNLKNICQPRAIELVQAVAQQLEV